ncbi:MATE efflux family protein [Coemansia reversa NRRL 1564]|uniref:MATE efflux family protein n=1 Tax=Coemansia reversa (strain ATCC 12441 / NRRL 1564) TaxID=763665 RepID=A0A2G5BKB1_COERN|nr:MATE efflux family protein [Coemansia reversa NRRL 1564]|eukprot:PIA19431.1 MATE efflux family protein [Coemansia reversa NRRL 1564]
MFAEVDSIPTSRMLVQESKIIVESSIPVVLAYVLQYSFSFISLLVVGHTGPDELAAVALANMALVVIVFSPGIGLASALDTFCSTSFTASRDRTLVGFQLQRGLIAMTCHTLVIVPIMWYLDVVLMWFRQDAAVSILCGQFVRVQLLGALPWLFFECIKRFLQAQGVMHISTYILLAVLPIHLATSYLFAWSPQMGMGFLGAALANVTTNWLILSSIALYTWRSETRSSWGGWTAQAFWTMPQYFRLAIPSMVMICAEWWILDLLAIAASYLGSTTLAAQSIVINTCSLTYQIADGLSVVVCNRVGNLIGQTRTRRAKLTAWLGIAFGVTVGIATLLVAFSVSSWWGVVYSDNKQIIAGVAAIMPLSALFQMTDAINAVGSGVLRSIGRQNLGALINLPTYYLIGFPLGLYLTYGAPNLGVVGLWYGLCVGVGLAVAMQLLICARTDWAFEVRRCMVRVSEDHRSLVGARKPTSDDADGGDNGSSFSTASANSDNRDCT